MKKSGRILPLAVAAAVIAIGLAACGQGTSSGINLAEEEKAEKNTVNLFGPMEKSDPDADNIARAAHELTVLMAEEKLGVKVEYRTYTAEDYLDKTYDEVIADRVRSNMDDIYLLNPDGIQILGASGSTRCDS